MEEEEDEEEEEEGGGGRSDYQWRQENWKNETCADSDIWNIREKEREKKRKRKTKGIPPNPSVRILIKSLEWTNPSKKCGIIQTRNRVLGGCVRFVSFSRTFLSGLQKR